LNLASLSSLQSSPEFFDPLQPIIRSKFASSFIAID